MKRSHRQTWLALGALVTIVFGMTFFSSIFVSPCESKMYGSENSTYVKYFSSPYCVACWFQKPIIEKLANESGDRFLLEEFDVDLCRDAAKPYYVQGVPAFLLNGTVHYGLQNEEVLRKLLITE